MHRHMESVSPDSGLTVLVVGAGAVENAWTPILRALEHYHDFPLTQDGATSFLARVVYLQRWHTTFPDPAERERLAGIQKMYGNICTQIRTEVRAAQEAGELRVRPEFDAIIERFLVKRRTPFAVINTNWDSTIEDALTARFGKRHGSIVGASHLHGSVRSDDPLYLPTELTREAYRSTDEHNRFGGLHVGAMQALECARHVVLYGLSLSPLDAELSQTIESGWNGSSLLESVDIIDLDHELVAHRVNLLVDPRRVVAVHGYHPSALETRSDYTIHRSSSNTGADA